MLLKTCVEQNLKISLTMQLESNHVNLWLTAHSANVWHSSDLSQAAF